MTWNHGLSERDNVRWLLLLLITGVFSMWGFVRPNNWLGYQTCGVLAGDLEYKMDDDDCGKVDYGYICGDIRTSSSHTNYLLRKPYTRYKI